MRPARKLAASATEKRAHGFNLLLLCVRFHLNWRWHKVQQPLLNHLSWHLHTAIIRSRDTLAHPTRIK